jgi:hypothetical protein
MTCLHRTALVALAAAAISLAGGAPAAAQAADAASKSDATCIAITLPSVEGVDDSIRVAESVRALFVSFLTGPTIKSIALDARLASQATMEAKQKNCTRVLTISLTRKAGSAGGHKLGAIGQAAATASSYVPYSGAAGEVAVGASVASAEAVSNLAYSTHAKDEMQLDYRVTTVDGATILAPKSDKAKAKSNGEDLVTPLVTRASQAIADAVLKT